MGAKCLVHTIGRPDLARFYQHLRDGGNSPPAIYNKQSYLGGKGSFFDWTINSGHYPAVDNRAKGLVRYTEKEKRQRKKHGFKAFDLEQVRVLYAPEHFSACHRVPVGRPCWSYTRAHGLARSANCTPSM